MITKRERCIEHAKVAVVFSSHLRTLGEESFTTHTFVCVCACVYVCVCARACMHVCVRVSVSVCLSVCLSLSLSVCVCVCVCVCVWRSAHTNFTLRPGSVHSGSGSFSR